MLEALRAENSQDSKADSLIRALRHIIEFHSGLLIRHLDLRLTPGPDPTGDDQSWPPTLDIFQDCLDLKTNDAFKPQVTKRDCRARSFISVSSFDS
jgi:hypothetical protein